MRFINNNKGVSLIELVVSLAILMMVILPFSGLFLDSVKMNSSAKNRQIATQYAQQCMEYLKGIDKSTFIADIKNYNDSSIPLPLPAAPAGFSAVAIPAAYNSYAVPSGTADAVSDYELIFELEKPLLNNQPNPNKMSIYKVDNGAADLVVDSMNYYSFYNIACTINSLNSVNILITNTSTGSTVLNENIPITNPNANSTFDIKLITFSSTDVTMDIENNHSSAARIFHFKGVNSSSIVDINTLLGSVYTYSNIFDSSNQPADSNRVYSILIKVSKSDIYDETKKIYELTGLRKIE
ncbi:MAG: type IV pilus modification PilV family protein [Bacillota bacterium]